MCVLAAGAVLSAACSYFLFTEMKILSTKKMCVRVRVCLLCDDSDGITFFVVVVVFPALTGGILLLFNSILVLPGTFSCCWLRH